MATRIELAPEVLDDVERFMNHMEEHAIEDGAVRIAELVAAIEVLAGSPAIGRPVAGGKRELIVGRGARGYVALYRFVPAIDTVFVLAVRSQRESSSKRAYSAAGGAAADLQLPFARNDETTRRVSSSVNPRRSAIVEPSGVA